MGIANKIGAFISFSLETGRAVPAWHIHTMRTTAELINYEMMSNAHGRRYCQTC